MSRSTHTLAEVKEADRLWDEMSLPKVSDRTGIPVSTLKNWSQQGLINTDATHNGPDTRLSKETIERIDHLWDAMPLTEISDLLGIPYPTLANLSQRDKISTDREYRGACQTTDMHRKVRRAAHLAYEKDITNREAARRMGVAESTFYRYLRLYRNGTYS